MFFGRDTKERRLAAIWVSPELVASFARARDWIDTKVESDIPEDAEFFSCHYDYERRMFFAVFEHESFDLIYEGSVIPMLGCPLVHQRINEPSGVA